MSVTLYDVSAPLFVQGLKGLLHVLEKAKAHAAARNIDPAALLTARLYPDMFPLTRQVQISADFAKGPVARLAGVQPPAWEDTETSFEELQARIEKTIAYIATITPDQINGQEDREITLVRGGVESVVTAQPYLLQQALPNFYFHITAAYAILRHNGVEIGKRDYFGAP